MNAADRLNEIKRNIPENIKIVAVSKTQPPERIAQLYRQTEHRIFGENRVQELNAKHTLLPNDIEWHLIGHLQTNKVKYIAPYVSLIQSVDSLKLLVEINKEAIKNNRVIPCLLQFYIATDETKYGFSMDEVVQMLENPLFHELKNVEINGVMGVGTLTEDTKQTRSEFKILYNNFTQLKIKYFADKPVFSHISMGMTNDYQIAIDEGSTIVRIGSGIFGAR